MNGIHDMGGMHGFGPVIPERDEPPFHATWEGRVQGIMRSLLYAGAFHVDEFRAAQELVPPPQYLRISYYERWLVSILHNLVEKGYVDERELMSGHAHRPGRAVRRVLRMADVEAAFARGSFGRPVSRLASFLPGDRVRARMITPVGHTRLPRYARNHVGTVEAVRGFHTFPDSIAAGLGEDPQWMYTVVFDARELWGEGADSMLQVSIEAFEPYLEKA